MPSPAASSRDSWWRAAGGTREGGVSPRPDCLLDGLWALLIAALVLGALGGWGLDGGRDWDEFQADLLSARRSVLEGELPFWMPYRGGGHDAWADPQSTWASPLGLLALAFGVDWGLRLFAAACAAVLALGGARLVRWLGGGAEARLVSAGCLALAPPLSCYMAAGVPTYMLALVALPWVVLGYLTDTRRGTLGAAAAMALVFYGGGVNHVVFHGLFLGVLAVALAAWSRSPAPLVRLALVAVAAMGLAAPKLLPAAALARSHPRPVDHASEGRGAVTLALLPHLLLDRDLPRVLERRAAEFVAVGRQGGLVSLIDVPGPEAIEVASVVDAANAVATTGWVALLLGVLGVGWGWRSRSAPEHARATTLALLAGALVLLWIAWGRNASPSLWLGLVRLPVLRSLRSPDKATLYTFFVVALLAGLGAQALLRRVAPRRPVRAVALFVVLGALLAEVHPPARVALRETFCEPPPPVEVAPSFRQVRLAPGPWGTRYGPPVLPAVRAGVGVVNGYAGPGWVRAHALAQGDPGYAGEAAVAGRTARLERCSARTWAARVGPGPAATLVVNQNHEPGWAVIEPAGATLTRRPDGRQALALAAAADETRVELRYTPPWLWTGLLVGLLTVAGLARYVRSSA